MLRLELTDKLPFGKHKGQTVEEIYKQDAGYLVWLRQKRKDDNGDTTFFSPEVSALLDMTIRESSHLARRYKPWDVPVTTDLRTEPVPQERPPETAYGGMWGMM
ncbi:MAG TPA: hypothetical protein VFS41_06955 [Edaphobacter sp.]|nr:hypothetical protein [Edaphobacter sp.]